MDLRPGDSERGEADTGGGGCGGSSIGGNGSSEVDRLRVSFGRRDLGVLIGFVGV